HYYINIFFIYNVMSLKLYDNKNHIEVGIDEVGRGSLIGRVYAASVIMPHDYNDEIFLQIKDSKKLNYNKREHLYNYIKDVAIDYGIGYIESDKIDEINIYNASIEAMHLSLDKLSVDIDNILVDGKSFRPYINQEDEFISHKCIINGDNLYLSIAAASILAKVERDRYILSLVESNENLSYYDIKNNKGYGTKNHLEAIKRYGITKFHRKSFGICKNYK
ncbi:unnamed protein product, partial [marine sediment metagenome]